MTLSRRLFAGFLAVIVVLATLVVVSVDRRVRTRLVDQSGADLVREARLIGAAWRDGLSPDSLADAQGALLGHRVTLIDAAGRVVGDSEFDEPALSHLENHSRRPEVVAALASGQGTAVRRSPSAGDREIYAAVRHPLGVARTSLSIESHGVIVRVLQRDVLTAATWSLGVALLLALVVSRSVVRPVLDLRDDARAIAAGDLARRPSLASTGEVGELASAFHRLAEQLSSRVSALEAEDALLRAVSDSLEEGVVAIDSRHAVQHMNEGARQLLGVRDALPFPDDRLPRERGLRDALAGAFRGAASDDVESELNGRRVVLTARPLPAGGVVLALLDVTRLRRLEAVRRDFVANVSHELKTPLTVIGGFAETLHDETVTAPQRRQFAATILANTRRMQRLVDDLLDLSRIESGTWRPEPARADFAQVAAEVLSTFADEARRKGVALATEIGEGGGTVFADPLALRQVLANLVDNAIRQTASGSVTVASAADGGGVTVSVRDTGSGIPAEHLPRVFERFYRVDAARSRQEGGTGLGLAIVKHLVEAHGGRVGAESAAGEGTTVSAYFPGAPGEGP